MTMLIRTLSPLKLTVVQQKMHGRHGPLAYDRTTRTTCRKVNWLRSVSFRRVPCYGHVRGMSICLSIHQSVYLRVSIAQMAMAPKLFRIILAYSKTPTRCNVPVIWNHGPYGASDSGDIAGLSCRDLTSDESRLCRCARVLIHVQFI